MKDVNGNPWWSVLLGDMGKTRVLLTQVAPDIYPLSAPHLGARPEQIAATEDRLGHPLDEQLKSLLAVADGWPDMFLSGDFMSTEQLGAGPLWSAANQVLDITYEDGPPIGFPPRAEVEPIHASPYNNDVFAIWYGGPLTEGGHPVIWFGGEIIEQYPNVYQWWLRAVALARRRLDRTLEQLGST